MTPRALIVDDSVTVRMDLRDALNDAGFHTTLCATAAAAKDALSREYFDVVVLDVVLPDGDGVALLKELKSAPGTRDVPVMLLSSEDEVRDRVRGLKTGADEYVGKPYDAAQVVSRARALVRRRKPAAREKTLVLLLDDSPTFRDTMAAALTNAGYETLTAAHGEEGLRLAADHRPDAVIVDRLMPGMDGVEVVRRIRADAALRRIPCLLLTAGADAAEEAQALDAGADAFVRKDGETAVVLAKLSALLRAGRGAVETPGPSLLGPQRVLTVDDSVTYLEEVSGQLREEGYDVVSARSGTEALELLAVQPVDAVLLDVLMPGLSGHETCRRIKENPAWRDIPLLMLTAQDERKEMLDGLNAGADDYIAKSSALDVLKARLKAQLRRRQFEDENRRFRDQRLRREMQALEVKAVRELADTRAAHIRDLEKKNEELRRAKEAADALARELESFSYSVSHDLRAPLRHIVGFTELLARSASRLDDKGQHRLEMIQDAAQRMGQLIDDMLSLARVSRKEILRQRVDLSALAREVLEELKKRDPERHVRVTVADGLVVQGDRGLLRILLENLLGNAWKFTSKTNKPRIAVEREGEAFVVRDNGAGFDMAYAKKLFGVFQRLHTAEEFPGTGVGLATVQRVVRRHGGRVWADGRPGRGAAFFFTLG